MSLRIYLTLTALLLAFTQWPVIQSWLAWDRQAILAGEIWRILTGNLTHTNWPHMIMNTLALAVISFIFRAHIHLKSYTGLILGLSVVVGIAILASDIRWYAGLSGVLHGVFAWGVMKDIQTRQKGGWLLLGGLIVKVGWEQIMGGSASSAALIGARVATEAHLAGALAGGVFALGCMGWQHQAQKTDSGKS